MFADLLGLWQETMVWGLAATVVMSTVLSASQGLGLSRLSLTFLTGTLFSGDRGRANLLGFFAYTIGGWIFAFIYVLILVLVPLPGLLVGSVTGFVHGLFLLAVLLPMLPYLHPRMASAYDGPTRHRRLEPPGFMGLNYGRRTPLITLAAQTLYGAVLGGFYQLH